MTSKMTVTEAFKNLANTTIIIDVDFYESSKQFEREIFNDGLCIEVSGIIHYTSYIGLNNFDDPTEVTVDEVAKIDVKFMCEETDIKFSKEKTIEILKQIDFDVNYH